MEFHQYPTLFDTLRKNGITKEEAHNRIITSLARQTNNQVCRKQLQTEQNWMDYKRPYYLVYPTVIPLLTRIKLKFDSSIIKFPQENVCLRFAKGRELGTIRSALVQRTEPNGLAIWIDVGETRNSWSLMTYMFLMFEKDLSIEDCYTKSFEAHESKLTPTETDQCKTLLQLICSIALIDDSDIINPDYLARDKDKSVQGTQAWNRAIRLRGPGWTIGKCYERELFKGAYIVPPHPQGYWIYPRGPNNEIIKENGRKLIIKMRSGYVHNEPLIRTIPSGTDNK